MNFTMDQILGTAPINPNTPPPTTPIQQAVNPDAFATSTVPDAKPAQTPLDNYKDLFKIDPTVKNPNDLPEQFISYDSDKLTQQINGMNLLQGDNVAELAQNALKGDPQALIQLVNSAATSAFLQSAKLSAKVSDEAVRGGMQYMRQVVPSQVRESSASQELLELNPALSHPAIAPVVASVHSSMVSKYPDASPKQLASMINDYFNAINQISKPNQAPQQNSIELPGSSNFENFFGHQTR
jgi:hypothetical protein